MYVVSGRTGFPSSHRCSTPAISSAKVNSKAERQGGFTGSLRSTLAVPSPTSDQWIGRLCGVVGRPRGGILEGAVLDQFGEQAAVVAVVDLFGHQTVEIGGMAAARFVDFHLKRGRQAGAVRVLSLEHAPRQALATRIVWSSCSASCSPCVHHGVSAQGNLAFSFAVQPSLLEQ